MKNKLFLSIVSVVLAAAPLTAIGAKIEAGNNYHLEPGSTVDDNLYAASDNLSILGTVNGDLLVAGGNINISGPVAGDVAAAGGTININSNIAGDARVAGGNIVVFNSISGELMAAAGQIDVMSGSSISKDIMIAGGSVSYAGKAGQNLDIKGDTVYVNGTVEKNLSIRAREIKIGPKASIQGDFDYYSPGTAVIEQGADIKGATNFHKIDAPVKMEPDKKAMAGFIGFFWALRSLAVFIAALVMFYFFKLNPATKEAVSGFWKEALKGFAILFIVPIAIMFCFMSGIGALLGVIIALFYAALIIVSSVTAVLLFAQLAVKYIFKKENHELNWWIIALSVLTLAIISAIPFLGWTASFIIFLSAFGSTTNYVYKKIKE